MELYYFTALASINWIGRFPDPGPERPNGKLSRRFYGYKNTHVNLQALPGLLLTIFFVPAEIPESFPNRVWRRQGHMAVEGRRGVEGLQRPRLAQYRDQARHRSHSAPIEGK